MEIKEEQVNKLDRSKIYLLVVVIIALLGTNAYLFFRDKHQDEKFVTVSTEKDRLELEVEKIEVELDKISSVNVNLNAKLQDEQQLARNKIAEVKFLLQKGLLTQGDLKNAQNEIKELREFVKNYNNQISLLKKENGFLRSERDSLQISVDNVSEKAHELEQKNEVLNNKVKIGAALKTAAIGVTALRIKSNGKTSEVTRASTANKLTIRFGISDNQLAAKDYHNIYLRVIDPAGNLIANNANIFEADGQELQYSSVITISYNNDATEYSIDWVNPNPFLKGTYTLILYADGYTMGRTQISLR